MAVTVPRLQAINPSPAMPGNERINIQAPNVASTILSRTDAVVGLAKEGLDVYKQVEDAKITQLGYKAQQDYHAWNAEQLEKLKSIKGDPTEAYVEYDKASKDKYDSIVNENPDLSERVRSGVTSELNRAVDSQRIAVLKQRGAQEETWKNTNFESQVKLQKTNLGTTSSFIQKGDPGSFLPMDQNIADIRTTIAKRAVEQGTAKVLPDDAKTWGHAYQDADGKMIKVELTPIAQQRTAKDVSEGIRESINSMIASGHTEEATAAMEKYKPYLDPKSVATLDNKFKGAAVDNAAFDFMGKIQGKSDSEQMKAILSISDEKLKSKALQIKDTNDNRIENMRKRRDDMNYNTVASATLDRMNGPNPYNGLAEAYADPVWKATFDRLPAKDQQHLIAMVKAPADTNPKSEQAVQNIMFGLDPNNKVENISPEEFSKFTSGLNKADKNKYTNMYNRLKQQTAGEERTMNKRAEQFLQQNLQVSGYIKKNDFGKYSNKDEIKLTEARNDLFQYLSAAKTNMSDNELLAFTKKYAADKAIGQTFVPPTPKTFVPPAPVSTKVDDKKIIPNTTKTDMDRLRSALEGWRKVHNGENPVKGSPDWINYLKNYK